jgi:deoxyribodipyrimidine photolyase
MKDKISVFWFRRDLRLSDNHGLFIALETSENVLPIFIFDTDILSKLENKEDKRVDFIMQTLQTLNDNFYFDQDHLYFLYNQYEITAYAAGPVLIKVPFSAIQTILKSEFKKRLGI